MCRKSKFAVTTLALVWVFVSAGKAQETQAPGGTAGQEHNNVKRAIRWKQFEYTCEGGKKVSVYLADSMAKVLYEGHQYLMKQTRSADGNRYSDGKVVWWGKGDGGFLQEEAADGNGRMLVKDCRVDKLAESVDTGTVTGTVSYLQKMTLPANAVIEVRLEDVSQANLPPKLIAEQKIPLGDRQLPVLFEVKFDPEKIDPRHSYELRANAMVDGVIRLTNVGAVPVLTLGHASHVDMIMKETAKTGERK